MMNQENKPKTVAVVIDKEGVGRPALKWAIENVVSKGHSVFLVSVKDNSHGSFPISSFTPSYLMPKFTRISSPSNGNGGGKGDHDSNPKDIFLPYRVYCTRKDIKCRDIMLNDTDETRAIVDFVGVNGVEVLVLGSTGKSNSFFRMKGRDTAAGILKAVPDYCSVFVISRGKIVTTKPSSRPVPAIHSFRQQILHPSNHHYPHQQNNLYPQQLETPHNNNNNNSNSNNNSLGTLAPSPAFGHHHHTPDETPSMKSLFTSRRGPNGLPYEMSSNDSDISFVSSGRPSVDSLFPRESFDSGATSLDRLSGVSDLDSNNSNHHNNNNTNSNHSFELGGSRHVSVSSGGSLTPTDHSFASQEQSHEDVEEEMRKLKQQLKEITSILQGHQSKEAMSAKQKAMELHKWKLKEQEREEESREDEEAAFSVISLNERAKFTGVIGNAEAVQRIAERESKRRISAEMKAIRESKGKNLTSQRLSDIRYRKYTIEEIEEATNYFNNSLKIGEGGYGPVYKCNLDHTPVAVKVLRPDAAHGRSQFHQEVEVLSCIRHPHMVLLLGACPEYGCLVYEYMCNGSLEDRLFRRKNSPSLSWQHRFIISHEIGIGLLFLHQTKPEPIVHRDLKPANILLDRNLVSKISDVGLARLVPPSVADSVTQYRMTSTAGTFCYIDPEYQQTGMLGVKSDIYSLGIIFLQLLTGKPPMGLTHHVERAIETDTFHEILDETVPNWPIEEALSLAKLALKCAQLRRKDRPDLGKVVMPELDNLKELAERNMPFPMLSMSGPLHSHSIIQTTHSQDDLNYPVTSQSDSTGSLKSE